MWEAQESVKVAGGQIRSVLAGGCKQKAKHAGFTCSIRTYRIAFGRKLSLSILKVFSGWLNEVVREIQKSLKKKDMGTFQGNEILHQPLVW